MSRIWARTGTVLEIITLCVSVRMAAFSLNTCDPYPWQAPCREKGPEPRICILLWFKVLSLTYHCSNANGDSECSWVAAAECWMPQSEAVALVSHTKLAPSPDCVVLLAIQGAGLKLATALYKTMQDRRQQKIILLFARITSFHVYVLCYNDVLTVIIHALHCYGQWLIVASYCAHLTFYITWY